MTSYEHSRKASRVSCKGATLPAPSEALLEDMAKGIYIGTSTNATITMSSHTAPEWEELREEVRDMWRAGARSAYAIVAVTGGSSPEEINANKNK